MSELVAPVGGPFTAAQFVAQLTAHTDNSVERHPASPSMAGACGSVIVTDVHGDRWHVVVQRVTRDDASD